MGEESAKQVLGAIISDSESAAQAAAGDFTTFADAELTDSERALLQAAASDLDDDVTGFGVFLKLPDIDGETTREVIPKLEMDFLRTKPNVAEAMRIFKF